MNSLFTGFDLTDKVTNAKIEKLRAERDKTARQIADAELKIKQAENRIKRLKGSLSKQERKARTKRLIERGAIAEAFIPDVENLTNDEFKAILVRKISSADVTSPVGEKPQTRAITGLA